MSLYMFSLTLTDRPSNVWPLIVPFASRFCACWSSLADNSARKTCSCAFTEAVSASDLVVDGSIGSQGCSKGNAYIVFASHVLVYQKANYPFTLKRYSGCLQKTTLGKGWSHSPSWIGRLRWLGGLPRWYVIQPIYLEPKWPCLWWLTLIDLQFEGSKGGNQSSKAFLRLNSNLYLHQPASLCSTTKPLDQLLICLSLWKNSLGPSPKSQFPQAPPSDVLGWSVAVEVLQLQPPILSSVSPCLGDMNITLATRELVLIQLMIHVRQSARTRGIFHPKNPNVPMKLHFMLGSKSLACLELWEVFVLAHCLFFKFPLTSNRKFQVNQPATHQPDRLKTHLRVHLKFVPQV